MATTTNDIILDLLMQAETLAGGLPGLEPAIPTADYYKMIANRLIELTVTGNRIADMAYCLSDCHPTCQCGLCENIRKWASFVDPTVMA